MSTEAREFRFDPLKWLLVAVMVVGAAVANSFFSAEVALLYRIIALMLVGVVAAFVAVNTTKGYAFWSLLKSSQTEYRKVVWPSRQEINQTTLIVVVIVIFMAIVLWGLDTGLGFLASKIIG